LIFCEADQDCLISGATPDLHQGLGHPSRSLKASTHDRLVDHKTPKKDPKSLTRKSGPTDAVITFNAAWVPVRERPLVGHGVIS
jgi:hypothetical protein